MLTLGSVRVISQELVKEVPLYQMLRIGSVSGAVAFCRLPIFFNIEDIIYFTFGVHRFECFPVARTVFLAPDGAAELLDGGISGYCAQPCIELVRFTQRGDSGPELLQCQREGIFDKRARSQEAWADTFAVHAVCNLFPSALSCSRPQILRIGLRSRGQTDIAGTAGSAPRGRSRRLVWPVSLESSGTVGRAWSPPVRECWQTYVSVSSLRPASWAVPWMRA
jgi:hypothetical protein